MAADPSDWVTIAVLVVFAVAGVVICVAFSFVCSSEAKEWWQSPPVRLFRLGGVTTLTQTLNYNCSLCQDSLEAGEKVRTLSCDHVFHLGGTVKCLGIDKWLRTGPMKPCPICRQVPHRVEPGKQPPQTSDSEELLFPAHWFDEQQPEA